MTINKVILVGRVGKEPEIRTFGSGSEVASFTLATSDVWKDKQTGERKEKTEWHKIKCFNKNLIEVIKKYVKKGSKLYIEGALQTTKLTDKDNVDRYVTEIVLKDFSSVLQLLDAKEKGEVSQGGGEDNTIMGR